MVYLQVFLDGTKFENRVVFDSALRANSSYGSLIEVVGLTQEELFMWLLMKNTIVDDPRSVLLLLDIMVAHKQFSLSVFEDTLIVNPKVNRFFGLFLN